MRKLKSIFIVLAACFVLASCATTPSISQSEMITTMYVDSINAVVRNTEENSNDFIIHLDIATKNNRKLVMELQNHKFSKYVPIDDVTDAVSRTYVNKELNNTYKECLDNAKLLVVQKYYPDVKELTIVTNSDIKDYYKRSAAKHQQKMVEYKANKGKVIPLTEEQRKAFIEEQRKALTEEPKEIEVF